jgi:hypothetical protein
MPGSTTSHSSSGGLTLKTYQGDRAVLLSFNLDQPPSPDFAGFAIKITDPGGRSEYLKNRLSFEQSVTAQTTMPQREAIRTPSDRAPFQKFRWLWVPAEVKPGTYTIEVTAMFLDPSGSALQLRPGPSTAVSLEMQPSPSSFPDYELGFTRGYLSSQYYAERFKNAPIEPSPPTFDYDTQPYQAQYRLLGGHAREIVFRVLQETLADPSLSLDVFAFDFNEPDIIHLLGQLGPRLRLILDNSKEHTTSHAPEVGALAAMRHTAGESNVVVGHFRRFAHDKIFIQKKNGTPVKVLTGSANFSVRGLYVQANNVMLVANPQVAQLYENVFDDVFTNMKGFSATDLAQQWFDFSAPVIPPVSASFAPHKTAEISLRRVADAIKNARSSVLFAVMNVGGGGPVLDELRTLDKRAGLFFYGVVQSSAGDLKIHKPGDAHGQVVDFGFLKGKVSGPFQAEYSGGRGQVIHHKFVVVDFNDADPMVFAGSSNLASGGETSNGDNLLMLTDPAIVTAYAIEAIRLFDHYHFRMAWKNSTAHKPLQLSQDQQAPWWGAYYDPQQMKYLDRLLFAR